MGIFYPVGPEDPPSGNYNIPIGQVDRVKIPILCLLVITANPLLNRRMNGKTGRTTHRDSKRLTDVKSKIFNRRSNTKFNAFDAKDMKNFRLCAKKNPARISK